MIDMPPAEAGFDARGAWLVRCLMDEFGMTDVQAAGVVGNLGFESAGLQGIHERGIPEGQGGYGWAQWTAGRRVSFFDYCTKHGLDWASDEANYGYLIEELRGPQAKTITQVKKTTALDAAVFTVGFYFERPAGTTPEFLPSMADRLRYAQRALAASQVLAAPTLPNIDWIDHFKSLQRQLAGAGFYHGLIDGVPGALTFGAMTAAWRAARAAMPLK